MQQLVHMWIGKIKVLAIRRNDETKASCIRSLAGVIYLIGNSVFLGEHFL